MNLGLKTQIKTEQKKSFAHAPISYLRRKKEPNYSNEECFRSGQRIQRKSANYGEPSEVPPMVDEALPWAEQPLDLYTSGFKESQLKHDLK